MEDDLQNGRLLQKRDPHLKNVTRTSKNGPALQKTDDDLKKRTTTSKDGRRPRKTDDDLVKHTTAQKTGRRPQKQFIPTQKSCPPNCSPKSLAKSLAKSSTKSSKKGRPEAGYRAALSSQKEERNCCCWRVATVCLVSTLHKMAAASRILITHPFTPD